MQLCAAGSQGGYELHELQQSVVAKFGAKKLGTTRGGRGDGGEEGGMETLAGSDELGNGRERLGSQPPRREERATQLSLNNAAPAAAAKRARLGGATQKPGGWKAKLGLPADLR